MRRLIVASSLMAATSFAADPESQPLHGPWRFEVSLSPVIGQVNDSWTKHLGIGGQLAIALSPHMRLLVGGLWNHQWAKSGFEEVLANGAESSSFVGAPGASDLRLLVPSGVYAGTDFGLAHGQIAPLRFPHRFEITVAGLVGALETRVALKPANQRADGSISPATSGDAGMRPTLGIGAGLHFEFLERFSLRLELRHFAVASRVSTVNGCGFDDLSQMERALQVGHPVANARVSAACRADTFDGIDPATEQRRSNDIYFAFIRLRQSSSTFQSYLLAQASVGVTF